MIAKTDELPLSLLRLFIIIFFEGFISISVEIITMRQLVPVVGNSVIVTSLIIGIFLLFLALGYYRGGFYRANYSAILRRNFTLSAVILGVGLCYFFISTFFGLLQDYVSDHSLINLTLYLVIVTAPLIYLLGQTVPITTNLFRDEYHVGHISGRVLFISTLGSFLGSISTALILMNFFGVAWTVMINYIALILIMVAVIDNLRKHLLLLSMMLLTGGFIYLINVGMEQRIFLLTNAYNNYQLVDYTHPTYGPGKVLSANESSSSFLNKQKKGFWYVEKIKQILFDDLKLKNKDILVLGAGGFSLTAEKTNGNHFVYNDIDKDIKPVAKRGFIEEVKGEFKVGDARQFLLDTKDKYDVVISDAYSNRMSVPFHLLTYEHFQNIRRVLVDNGIVIFNFIASPTYESKFAKRVDNTLRQVFPSCVAMPLHYSDAVDNILYVCKKSKFDQDKTIYTDNKNPAALDFFER